MCECCQAVGIVEEICNYPIRRVRKVICPEGCIWSLDMRDHLTKDDMEWRIVGRRRSLVQGSYADGQKYISLFDSYKESRLNKKSNIIGQIKSQSNVFNCSAFSFFHIVCVIG